MSPAPRAVAVALGALALAGGLSTCGDDDGGGGAATLPQGAERVELDPSEFTTTIDNPYWPMVPGSRWVYRETDGEGGVLRDVVTVERRTKRIANGIEARVVHDVATEDGEKVEDTFDWYAQDAHGNVWYLGEDTKEYEHGRVTSTEGSFEAGRDGAQAGVVVPSHPRVGLSYRQEQYAGHAEDRARVFSLDEQAEVPLGHFTGVLATRESNPLEPKVLEYKLYARGIGPVLALTVSGGRDREELVSYRRGG